MRAVDCLDGFEVERFLADYWQQRPCLIRGWLQPTPVTLESLVDLAADHDLPARLVTGTQDGADWTLMHGPIEQADLPASGRNWTLLVQEMDKVCPAATAILDPLRFLPDWMIDDVMISQAADGGSVGAHVDAYDVFLVQAAGKRRWQLATEFDPLLDERFEMALLANWQPETELIAAPGDALYLPAGIAHHGVADGPCQTWSIGLRTPTGPELLFFLAEALSERPSPRLPVSRIDRECPALLDAALVKDTRRLLENCLKLEDSDLASITARFLSSWRLWHEDNDDDTESNQGLEKLLAGHRVTLRASARLTLTSENNQVVLYVNGERIECPPALARSLATTRCVEPEWRHHPDAVEQLAELDAIH
ncbi:MAG: cupin domain-containing protein [Wenzhouxiangella sp.]